MLNDEKTKFYRDYTYLVSILDQEISNDKKFFYKVLEKQKYNDLREKQLDEREDELKRQIIRK